MTDDKKKPDDETPKAQAEDAKPSEDLSDDELSNAAGGTIDDSPPARRGVTQIRSLSPHFGDPGSLHEDL